MRTPSQLGLPFVCRVRVRGGPSSRGGSGLAPGHGTGDSVIAEARACECFMATISNSSSATFKPWPLSPPANPETRPDMNKYKLLVPFSSFYQNTGGCYCKDLRM